MTAEVQPVCARCGHTPLEHSAGPCHQRSAAGVGCDCGGWAEIVTGGNDGGDIDAIRRRRSPLSDEQRDALCDEVDRLRAEVARMGLHSLGCGAGEDDECEAPEHGPCLHRALWDRVHAAESAVEAWGDPRHVAGAWPTKGEEAS